MIQVITIAIEKINMGFFETIERAVTFAKSVLDLSSKFNSSGDGVAVSSKANDQFVAEKVQEASRQIKEAIKFSTQAIIEKIENDKLEELNSRIDNLSLVLKFEKHSDILAYILLARESIHYAENRIREGKKHWIGPCLIAKSAVLAVLEKCAINADKDRSDLLKCCEQAKHEVLDLLIPEILRSGKKVPWDRVQIFLNDVAAPSGLMELVPQDDLLIGQDLLLNFKSDFNGVINWKVNVNACVEQGQHIASVGNSRVWCSKTGKIQKILKSSGGSVRIGDVIAAISYQKKP